MDTATATLVKPEEQVKEAPKEQLYKKVDDGTLPSKRGEYITNFGSLEFDGKTFRMNGSGERNRFPTSVDWWMTPQ